ncbi:MAG: hypothetical protein WCC63_01990 [Candidatus Bathyarchaeia archaeon]
MPHDRRENWLGLLSFGFFLLLFALFFVIVPDYGDRAVDFFRSFELKEVSPNLFLPAPEGHHPVVYETVMRFCIVFGLFQFSILAFRLYFGSAMRRIAETVSNIVLWLGAAYMFSLLLLPPSRAVEWFPFIGGMIAVVGFSIVIRSLVTLLFWRRSESTQ